MRRFTKGEGYGKREGSGEGGDEKGRLDYEAEWQKKKNGEGLRKREGEA